MECPTCKEPTRAVRSVYAGPSGRAVERQCPNGHRWTFATQLVGPIQKRGDGPHATAAKIERGENPVPEHEYVEVREEDTIES